MTTIIYEYEIPDPRFPVREDERGLGPSGQLARISHEGEAHRGL